MIVFLPTMSDLAEPLAGPAAHSMDTEWFALDALGHVGVFDSGEGGGVPTAHFDAWAPQSSFDALLRLLLGEPKSVGLGYDLDRLFAPYDGKARYAWESHVIAEQPEQLGDHGSVLVELHHEPTDMREWEAMGGSSGLVRLPGPRPLLHGWLDQAQLAARWSALGVKRVRVPYEIEPHRLGLFSYACEDYSAGPYVRRGRPRSAALRVEQLSAHVRSSLAQVVFEALDFREAEAVQPFEHMPSSAWSDEWLGTDGEMHGVE